MVFSKAVLEHIPADKVDYVIRQQAEMLKEGGIAHHNIDTEWGVDETHVTIKPISWWRAAFEKNGFVEVDIKKDSGGVYWCVWRRGHV
jgi:hypothetical protein